MLRLAKTVAAVALCFLAGTHLARAEPIYVAGGQALDEIIAEYQLADEIGFKARPFHNLPDLDPSLANALASASFLNVALLDRPHTPTGLPGWRYGWFKSGSEQKNLFNSGSEQPTPAPEPATLLLLGGGLAGVLARKRRRSA